MADHKPSLPIEKLRENFADIAPPLSANEAALEANRCLYCFDAPCIKACPTSINVPSFIRQIGTGDLLGAAKTILSENIFGGSCARVCPTEVLCEGACVYNGIDGKPIQIGRLQRFATDYAAERGERFFVKGKSTGKRVAVVGAGPGGLSCAHELARLGHDCTVYEASSRPGGLNTWGVAGYKIDTGFAVQEANFIAEIGVQIKLNTPVGDKPSVRELLESYDAVFLAVGMGKTVTLGIPGEELDGCMEATEFIKPTREPDYSGCKVGSHVVVVGGGNTAIDVATAAVRLGAGKVTMLYRRTASEMPAYDFEYELAKHDGVSFEWLAQPLRIEGKDGRVCALHCRRLKLTPDAGGRGKLEDVADSDFVMPCDMVVFALGQEPHKEFLSKIPGLKLHNGSIAVDSETCATSVPGLYAGGDCVKVAEVVNAVAHGKKAARAIHTYLMER